MPPCANPVQSGKRDRRHQIAFRPMPPAPQRHRQRCIFQFMVTLFQGHRFGRGQGHNGNQFAVLSGDNDDWAFLHHLRRFEAGIEIADQDSPGLWMEDYGHDAGKRRFGNGLCRPRTERWPDDLEGTVTHSSGCRGLAATPAHADRSVPVEPGATSWPHTMWPFCSQQLECRRKPQILKAAVHRGTSRAGACWFLSIATETSPLEEQQKSLT